MSQLTLSVCVSLFLSLCDLLCTAMGLDQRGSPMYNVQACMCGLAWVRGIYRGLKSPAISFEICVYVHLLHDNWPPLYRLCNMNVYVCVLWPVVIFVLLCLFLPLLKLHHHLDINSASPSSSFSFVGTVTFLKKDLNRRATQNIVRGQGRWQSVKV